MDTVNVSTTRLLIIEPLLKTDTVIAAIIEDGLMDMDAGMLTDMLMAVEDGKKIE
tara:strand:- start:351 stop:515 length:165 start_codon:yes stop_codon:yes gene_type:complete